SRPVDGPPNLSHREVRGSPGGLSLVTETSGANRATGARGPEPVMEVASKSPDAQNGLSMLSRHETKRYRFGHLPSSRKWQPAIIIHAILFAATGNPWTAVKVVLLLQLVVGISSAYALAADFHAGRAGRAVATLAYVTAPFFQAQMAHHLFNSWGYALLPAAFLLLLRYLRDRSLGSALLAGLGVAPILVSSPLAVFFLGLPLVVFCLSHSIAGTTGEGHPPRRSKGPRFAVAASMRRAKTVTARILVSFFPVGLGVLFAAFYL